VASLILGIGCGSSSSLSDGGGGAAGGSVGGDGGAGAAGQGGVGGESPDAGPTTTCDAGCSPGSVCLQTQIVGSHPAIANDAGVCPSSIPIGGECQVGFNYFTYTCVPIPASCNGTVSCACAGSILCPTTLAICVGPSDGGLMCLIEAP